MKTMPIYLTIVLAGAAQLVHGAAPSKGQSYFPEQAVAAAKTAFGTSILLDGYARSLQELGQPSLYEACAQPTSTGSTYRFLYLSGMGDERIVVTIGGDGSTKLTAKAVGKGASNSYRLEAQSDLSAEAGEALANAASQVRVQTDQPITSPVDGDSLVLESCRAKQYRLIYRLLPTKDDGADALLNLGEQFIHSARLDLTIRPVVVDAASGGRAH